MKLCLATTALSVAFALSGCWVRLPSRGPDSIRSLVGHTATTTEKLYIYIEWDGAREASAPTEYSSFDDKNHIVPIGERLKATSIVSRRLPPGLAYYLVMKPQTSNLPSFDYLIGFGRSPLPINDGTLIWETAEQGAAVNP